MPNLINTYGKQLGILMFAGTSPMHNNIGSVIDRVTQANEMPIVREIAEVMLSRSTVAAINGAISSITKSTDSSLSTIATVELHKMDYFLDFFQLEENQLKYIKKWCNWLTLLGTLEKILNIPTAIRQTEVSDGPVEDADINNPETPELIVQGSTTSCAVTGSIISSSFISNKSELFPPPPRVALNEQDIKYPPNAWVPSQIQTNIYFNEEEWVVSLVNYSLPSSGVVNRLIGHSILLVEGIKAGGALFVGRYEIQATLDSGQVLSGYISSITTNEDDNTGCVANIIENHNRCCSFKVKKNKVEKMIEDIKQDQKRTNLANGKIKIGEHIRYQFLGKSFLSVSTMLFDGNYYDGINCSEWCRQKLRNADIALPSHLNKDKGAKNPEKAAGGCCLS